MRRSSRPAGGKGSNQYQTRGTSTALRDPQQVAAITAAVADHLDAEAVAATFGDPVPTLEKARSHKDMMKKVAAGSDYDKGRIAERKNCPPDLLLFLASDDYSGTRLAVASNPNCPPEALAIIAEHAPANDGVAALTHENCPPEAIRGYATRDGGWESVAVGCPNTPTDMLWTIAERSRSLQEMEMVASHHNTDPELLAEMATPDSIFNMYWKSKPGDDPDGAPFQLCVGSNPSAKPETLDAIAHRPGAAARTVVARNPSTAPETLLWIAEAGDRGQQPSRLAIENPSFPRERLEEMIADWKNSESGSAPAEKVVYQWQAKAAADNPALTGPALEDAGCLFGGKALQRCLEDPDCNSYRVFTASLRFSDRQIVRATVSHPNCPPDVLAAHSVAHRRYDQVAARHIAENPNTPPEILESLWERGPESKPGQIAKQRLVTQGLLQP